MITLNFKQKIVMFYYRLLIGKCFIGWKSLYKSGNLKSTISQKSINESDISDIKMSFKTINLVNKNLDKLPLYNIDIYSNVDSNPKFSIDEQ
jgi:hypothetical protein